MYGFDIAYSVRIIQIGCHAVFFGFFFSLYHAFYALGLTYCLRKKIYAFSSRHKWKSQPKKVMKTLRLISLEDEEAKKCFDLHQKTFSFVLPFSFHTLIKGSLLVLPFHLTLLFSPFYLSFPPIFLLFLHVAHSSI